MVWGEENRDTVQHNVLYHRLAAEQQQEQQVAAAEEVTVATEVMRDAVRQ